MRKVEDAALFSAQRVRACVRSMALKSSTGKAVGDGEEGEQEGEKSDRPRGRQCERERERDSDKLMCGT